MRAELLLLPDTIPDRPFSPGRRPGILAALGTVEAALAAVEAGLKADFLIATPRDGADGTPDGALLRALARATDRLPTRLLLVLPDRVLTPGTATRAEASAALPEGWTDAGSSRPEPGAPGLLAALDLASDLLAAQDIREVLVCGPAREAMEPLAPEHRRRLVALFLGQVQRETGRRAPAFFANGGEPGSGLADWLPTRSRAGWGPGAELHSICVPCTFDEIDRLEGLLAAWTDPRLIPSLSADPVRPRLLLVLNRAEDRAVRTRVQTLLNHRPELRTLFSSVSIHFAGLTGAEDLYVRDGSRTPAPLGQKAGPNFLFFAALEAARSAGGTTFVNEVDCLPLRAGWMDDLDTLARDEAPAWVIGAPYLGNGTTRAEFRTHLNGNALYRVGDPAFQTFVERVWKARLLKRVPDLPMLAYDCWWSLENSLASPATQNPEWFLLQKYGFLFRSRPFVLNAAHADDDARVVLDRHRYLSERGAAPVLLHGPLTKPLAEALVVDASIAPLEVLRRIADAQAEDDAPVARSFARLIEPGLTPAAAKPGPPPRKARPGAGPKTGPGTEPGAVRPAAVRPRPVPELPPGPAGTIALGSGFHQIEGPNGLYPMRYAWCSTREPIVVMPRDLSGELALVLREGRKGDLESRGLPALRIERNGRTLTGRIEPIDPPGFLRIVLPADDLVVGEEVRLHLDVPTFSETAGGRELGLILFEIGLRFEAGDGPGGPS